MSHETVSCYKTAIVFGGSRGIGAAAANRLAADGFCVALTYVARPDKAEEVVASIKASGGQAIAIQADSVDADAIHRAVATAVAHFGPLDVALVNSGVLRTGSLAALSLDDLDLMLDVNVRGVFLSIQAAAAQMRDGGRIITMGSNTAERTGSVAGSAYAMTKAAVASLVRGLALDLASRRITINNIQPGPIATDMTSAMVTDLGAMSPLGRVGQPTEIAGLVSYLASEDSGYMTGSSITIDGGFIL